MKNKFLPIAMLLCLTASQKLSAQWQVTTGPSQPNIVSVATSGTNTFAAAGTAVSYTANNGTNWSLVSTGLVGNIRSVVTKGSDVFAGASGGAVFQSSNNGTNWTNTSTGLPAFDILSFAVSGTDIYAGTFGVYKSINNGLQWTHLSLTWNANVNSIAVSGSTILAATTSSGIYKSPDSGANWNTINTGLPTAVNAVIIVGSTFLAGTNAGLYISTNGGSSWSVTSVTSAIGSFTAVGNNVFAGGSSGDGVFLSTNSGTSWTAINTGLSNMTVYSLATNSTYVFAGTTGYVFRRLLSELIPFTVSTSSNPSNGGTTTGGGSFTSGTSVTVSATANNGFTFNNWTENGNVVSANSTYTFTIAANRNLVAEFLPSTSIQEQSADFVSVYPNPSIGKFIVSIDKLCSLKIYNSIGQLALTKENARGLTEINLNEKGTYLLIIQEKNSNKISQKQIIIQ